MDIIKKNIFLIILASFLIGATIVAAVMAMGNNKDIEKFEKEQEIPKYLNGHNYVQENKEWLRIHENQSNN